MDGLCRAQFIKYVAIFFGGEGVGLERYFWEVVGGVHGPALLILTLLQNNIYKVNEREYTPSDFCRQNQHTLITNLTTIKHVKRRWPLNEDVFRKLAYCAFPSSPPKGSPMSTC